MEDKLAEVASMKEELARASKEAELEEVDEGVSRTDTAWAFRNWAWVAALPALCLDCLLLIWPPVFTTNTILFQAAIVRCSQAP